jgi:microcystin degradation protein MlrC
VNAEHAAKQLALRLWETRRDFRFEMDTGPVDVCIQKAAEVPVRPVLIGDSGDNPTAGGAGDVPYVLERLLALEVSETLLAGIADAAAVERCEVSGAGARIELELGGKLDPVNGRPLRVSGEVVSVHPNPWPRGDVSNSAALLQIDGVCVVLTERRTPFHRLEDFQSLGIDPRHYQIVVVKIGYLVPGLKQFAAGSLLALSPGAVNQDITALPYRRLQRPLYPFDPDMEWAPPERSLV